MPNRTEKKSDPKLFDVLIVGSGPAGVQAAEQLVECGLTVGLVDIGYTDLIYAPKIPGTSFSSVRHTDANQAFFFLGENPKHMMREQDRAGAHLTPPRQHMLKNTEKHFPVESTTFYALMSTSRGGLGTSWGANCFAFSEPQLTKIGINCSAITPYYDIVSSKVGVSSDKSSDLFPRISNFKNTQPPLNIDTNAAVILNSYARNKHFFPADQFVLGKSPLACLTLPLDGRKANPYHDMDFWSDNGRSVYRPAYTLEKLQGSQNFTYLTARRARNFSDRGSDVVLRTQSVDTDDEEIWSAKKLILAAGALNSCRLVSDSFEGDGHTFPVLCNGNEWIAAINLPMLGRPAADQRYSLAQLTAIMQRSDADDELVAQFYSYRSLLLYRIVKELPLPTWLAVRILRLLLSSLTLINLHYSDEQDNARTLRFEQTADGNSKMIIMSKTSAASKKLARRQRLRFFLFLIKLGVIPLKTNAPKDGASIHYAGTLPLTRNFGKFNCSEDSNLWNAKNVYVADSSSWNFLPARGLTLTIMSNARLVADKVRKSLEIYGDD